MSNPIIPQTENNQSKLDALVAEAQKDENSINHELGLMLPKNLQSEEEPQWQSLFRLLRNMYLNNIIQPGDTVEIQQSFYKMTKAGKQLFLKKLMDIFDKRLSEIDLEEQLFRMETIDQDFDEKYAMLPEEYQYLMIKFAKGEVDYKNAESELEKIRETLTAEKYSDALTVFNEIKEGGLRLDKDQPEDTIPNTRPGSNIITQMTPKMVSPERLREIIAKGKSRQQQLTPEPGPTPAKVEISTPQVPQIQQQPPTQNPIPTQAQARVSQTPPAFPVRNSAAYRNLPGVVRPGSK